MKTPVFVRTPNFNSRKGELPRLIVLHSDASPNSRATRGWIQNPASKVSYHLEIERDGTVVRYVDDADRAWAVGISYWRGEHDLNSISLSASFANRNDRRLDADPPVPGEPLRPVQIATMHEIVAMWRAKYAIEDVVMHADVARPAGRKSDPRACPNFDIEAYR